METNKVIGYSHHYKNRKQLMDNTKFHKAKGYNDTYEASTTMLFDDYLIMMEQAEKAGVSVSNQIANVVHSYIEDHKLTIEKECNKRIILGNDRQLRNTNSDFICLYVPIEQLQQV